MFVGYGRRMNEKPKTYTIPLYKELEGWGGYVKLVESWGSDERVVETARMSTDGAFRGWGTPDKPGDEKLLAYMWTHHHGSPFEFCGATIEFEVPIFVIRQLHRHRTFAYSELSSRYTELPDTMWLPLSTEVRKQGGTNRQGSVTETSESWGTFSEHAVTVMERSYRQSREAYEELIAGGMAKEQARAVLPVAQYTRCRMTGSLRNYTHMLGLREDAHAQVEIQALANGIHAILGLHFPRTMALFEAYDVNKPVVGRLVNQG